MRVSRKLFLASDCYFMNKFTAFVSRRLAAIFAVNGGNEFEA